MTEIDRYLVRLYKESIEKQMINKSAIRKEVTRLLGCFESPVCRGVQAVEEPVHEDGYTREHFQFYTTGDLTARMYVLTPAVKPSKKYPGVLALHGHGKGYKEMVGIEKGSTGHHCFALDLVKRGFKVFVPEMIGFGDRMLKKDKEGGVSNSCFPLAAHLLMSGKTLAGLRVYEARRVLDIMENWSEQRFGVVGFSGGGMIAAFTAMLDRRVQATVLSGFANTFKGSILAADHCLDNYIPGLLKVGELPALLGLITPKPLFIEAGLHDQVFPIEPAQQTIQKLTLLYKELGVGSQFSYDLFDGGHEVKGEQSFDWLSQHLHLT
ncbi:hypothetical protein GCM10010954_23560 [Halobacillus andaensis]|uniref:Dienelactone hydrolase n=1 Tax=Halobacillus andaensis TaxID=1176239 RepID=A0A917B5R8_HALAA|nr:alpha/beta hydrolase family protein [Halobacillus andaensis]MBP2006053.1 dienelactone hydrolase [Halobacillus andaensis]GGF23968.1 hypothetical protein GCM10010954_23560 [Halobacillus andaensis]